MMTPTAAMTSIRIDRVDPAIPPLLFGTWGSRALRVELDSSAIIKLKGNGADRALRALIEQNQARIAGATSRLLSEQGTSPLGSEISVILTALDFD